jgi:predicted dehydrogenase
MDIAAASKAVLAAVKAKRIGTPVSVRIVDHTSSDPRRVDALLVQALETASRWLGAEVGRLVALGGAESGQISALAQFPKGQTALVSVGTRGRSCPLLEAVVVGNRGILCWEPHREPAVEPQLLQPKPSQSRARLLDAVHKSLESGGPVTLAGASPPPDAPAAGEPPQSAGKAGQGRGPRPAARKPPYGVLLVAGAYTHQENYAEDFAADPRCRLVGLTDEPDVPPRRKALNEVLAQKLGIPLLPDLDRALASEDVHLVSICAEPERRARVILRCAEAGKHLYLDKPMTASAEEAQAVAAAAGQAGVVSQMFSLVRTPAAARLRELLRSGPVGQARAIHFDLTFAKGPAGTVPIDKPRAEQHKPRRFELVDSKRELYNVGVYPLVLLSWLLGRPVRRVFAVTANYFFAEHKRNHMEDFAVALMELDGGLVATLACGRTGWRSHAMGGLNRTCVAGSNGVACVDAYRPRLEIWADEAPWLPPRRHPEDPMGFWRSTFEEVEGAPKQVWLTPPGLGKSDVAHFLDCIEQGRQSDVSAEVGADVMRVLMAAYESAATGRFVALAE